MWSPLGIAITLLILGSPSWVPALPSIVGWVFPVTSKVDFLDIQKVEGGLTVRMSFTKLNEACELRGQALDIGGVPITFERVDGGTPIQLPSGKRVSGPWFVGADDVKGVRLRFVHTCPFVPFPIITVGYP